MDNGDIIRSVKRLIAGWFHLWYLPAMILAAVVLRRVMRSRHAVLICVLCAAAGVGLQYWDVLVSELPKSSYRNGLFLLLPMAATGLWLARRPPPEVPDWAVVGAVLLVLIEASVLKSLAPWRSLDVLMSLYVAAPLIVAREYRLSVAQDCRPAALYRVSDWIYVSHAVFLLLIRDHMGDPMTALLTLILATGTGLATVGLRSGLRTRGIQI